MIRTVPDTRWSCGRCSLCCQGVEHGPVEPETIARLEAAEIASLWPPAADGWRIERPGPDGTPVTYLTHRGERCVFLREDNLCAIHALLGADAKPGFCREFPFLFVQDAVGVTATIREACGSWHEQYASGPVVDEERAREALETPRVVPRLVFDPEVVVVLPGKGLDPSVWLKIEPKLVTLESVSAIRSLLADLLEVRLPEPDSRQYEAALRAILGPLATVLTRGAAHDERLSEVAGWVTSASQQPVAPLADDIVPFARTVLQNQLLAKRFASFGQLPAGLGAYLLGNAIAAAPTLPAFGARLAQWSRVSSLPPVHRLLRSASGPLTHLFLHAT